jgi:ABC-2 type transport system ATP-binding protein
LGPPISVQDISKTYSGSSVRALDRISLDVREGTILALLGLNGAGKTTLTRILLDLSTPDEGFVFLSGASVQEHPWPVRVGYLPELFTAPKWMSVQEMMRYVGRLAGLRGKELISRIDSSLCRVGLEKDALKQVGTFSKGMMQRLGFAQALLTRPQLMVLDEPTEGLDPLARRSIRELLRDLASQGTTIWLTSHMLSEVESLADDIAILHHGRLIEHGAVRELLADTMFEIELAHEAMIEGFTFLQRGSTWTCTVNGSPRMQELLMSLQRQRIPLLSVQPQKSRLEDLFVSLLSRQEP